MGRNPAAYRTIGPRALVPLTVAAIAISGCGSGTEQSADEPEGKFPVEVEYASFPTSQRLATTSNMVIQVRNPGEKKIPVISVTVKCKGHSKGGSGGSPSGGDSGGFAYRTTQPGVADPARPRFIVNRIPTRTPRVYDQGRLDPLERSSSYVDTYPLGELKPGDTVTFRWNVTAVKAGPFKVCWRVNAGLDGKAKAVPSDSGQPIKGAFEGEVGARPPQSHIAEDGKTIVEGEAVSGGVPGVP
ncbi:MAG TPA: hypothetical protein VJT75_13230 [Thermoleophilaceae bacterium]|nr:hypothetical protein [Thermoleophilaceae bacterium]